MYEVKRSESEIDELINQLIESEETGESKYPGMTYEQGVRAGVEWVTGETDDHPMED